MNNSFKINQLIIDKLNSLGMTISTCECLTGGLLANNLEQVENANKVFLGGIVPKSLNSKLKILKVDNEILSKYSLTSKELTTELALKTKELFKTDISISISENLSNLTENKNKQYNLAYICIYIFNKSYIFTFESKYQTKSDVINECVAFSLINLWELIKDFKK